jgi:quercetin dioxygenase-like cupin family protein
MADGYFIPSGHALQVEMSSGIHRRTLGTTDEVMLCEFFLEKDAIVIAHSHKNDQVGYLVYGSVEMTIGGQVRILQPGESYAIPGGIVHSARALANSLAIDCFSPPRDDYRTEAR